MKLVKEAIEDVLKPKQFKNKLYYASNNFVEWPVFVFRIIDFLGFHQSSDSNDKVANFKCEVVYNERMISGPDFYDFDKGKTFFMDQEDFEYREFKELDEEVFAVIDQTIEKLELKKNYFQGLINES